jgi:hypothetical protein
MSLFTEICEAAKTKPRAGESFEDFSKRATHKIQSINEKEWGELSEAAQNWHNTVMTITAAHKKSVREAEGAGEEPPDLASYECEIDGKSHTGLPELEGFEAVPGEPEEAAAEEAEGEPEQEASAEADPPKSKRQSKASKPKPAAKTKGVKAAKATSKPRAKGTGRTPSFSETDKIKILVKENPHRKDTVRGKAFAKLKTGMTVGAAIKAGCPRQQIWSMKTRKIISLG